MSQVTPFQVYQTYLGLKLHFSSEDYDFLKFKGKTKSSFKAFEKRNDKAYFYRLAKRDDYENFLLANFLENRSLWIGEMIVNHTSENIFKDWSRRQQSISYVFAQDLKQLDDDFSRNFTIERDQLPNILTLFVQRRICVETTVLLFDMIDYFPYLDKRLSDNLVWAGVRLKLRKYLPFVKRNFPDLGKFRILSKAHFVTA